MRRWTMFAALLAGCYRPTTEATCSVSCPTGACPSGMTCGADGLCRGALTDDCSAINDARLADAIDADEGQICVGEGLIRNVCFDRPNQPIVFTGGTLDTNDANCSATRVQADGTKLCFFLGTAVTISGTLRVTGPNPAVFVGIDEVTITATALLDVSGRAGEATAPAGGAENKGCAPPSTIAGSPDPMVSGGGGGAGATFTALGGVGGNGLAGGNVVPGGTVGSNTVVPIMAVRGGCTGGPGGNGTPGSGSLGGYGGGAVYLISKSIVRLAGRINASGAGGWRPTISGGAGGGGSGGFIGLDAPSYTFSLAQIYAVGGSGGAGAGLASAGFAGNQATGPASPGQTMTTGGGGAGGAGGALGDGSAGATATNGAGGGGGGSTGFIGIANTPGMLPVGTFAPNPIKMN